MGHGERVRQQVSAWPGVSVHPHRFGGSEYRFGKVELGHVHGDRLADLPFPRATRDRLVSEGRALPHHVLPDSGWVSRPMATDDDATDVIELFRLNYERIATRRGSQRARLPKDGERPAAGED